MSMSPLERHFYPPSDYVRPRAANYRVLGIVALILALLTAALWVGYSIQKPRVHGLMAQRAQATFDAGDLTKAIHYQRMLVDHDPADREAFEKLALWLARSNDMSTMREAFRLLDQVVRRNDKHEQARKYLLALNLRAGNRKQVLDHANALYQLNPADAETWRHVAQGFFVNDENNRTYEAYEKALRIEPKSTATLNQYIYFLLRTNFDRKRADELLAQLTTGQDATPDTLRLAYGLQREFRLPSATTTLQEGLKRWPNDQTVIQIAAAHAIAENPSEVEGYVQKLLAVAPESAQSLLLAGKWSVQMTKLDRALNYYEKGRKSNPNNLEFNWRAADVLLDMGRVDDAEKLLSYLMADQNVRVPYLYLRARISQMSGNRDTANEQLEAAQIALQKSRMDPDTANELLYKTSLLQAWLAETSGDVSKAIALAERMSEAMPAEYAPFIIMGRLYMSLNLYDKARDAFQRATKRSFCPRGAQFELARAMLLVEREKPFKRRNFSSFEKQLEVVNRELPSHPDVPNLLTEYALAQGDLKTAIVAMQRNDQLHPNNPMVGLTLLRTLILARNWSEATALVETLKKRFEGSQALEAGGQIAFAITQATMQVEQGNTSEAEKLLNDTYTKFESVEQQGTMLRIPLASLALLKGDLATAENSLRRGLGKSDLGSRSTLALFNLLLEQGDYDRCFELVNGLKASRDSEPDTWRVLDAWLMLELQSTRSSSVRQLAQFHLDATTRSQEWWGRNHLQGMLAEIIGSVDRSAQSYRHSILTGYASPFLVNRLLALEGKESAQEISLTVRSVRFPNPSDRVLDLIASPTPSVDSIIKLPPCYWHLATTKENRNELLKRAEQMIVEHPSDPKFLYGYARLLREKKEVGSLTASLNQLDSKSLKFSSLASIRFRSQILMGLTEQIDKSDPDSSPLVNYAMELLRTDQPNVLDLRLAYTLFRDINHSKTSAIVSKIKQVLGNETDCWWTKI